MSSKRNRHRNPYKPSTNQSAPQQHSNLSFEELQLCHLQVMVTHLANKAYLSVGDIDEELQKEALAPLRIYAQYLNLYMKFKDKCFSGEETNQQSQKRKPTKAIPKNNIKEVTSSHPAQTQNTGSILNRITTPNRIPQTNNTSALLVQPPNGSQRKHHKT